MKVINVVAAVIHNEEKFFATQRGYGEFKDGWEFPGGKIEQGETHQEALIREIKEELDSDIKVDSFIKTIEYDYPTFHLVMHCYLCSLVNGDLTLKEHEASKWVSKTELDSIDWLPADLELIDELKKIAIGCDL